MAEVLALDPDPLASLAAGRVPAIIIRGALPVARARSAAKRLAALSSRFTRRSPNHFTLGADLHPHLGASQPPEAYASVAKRWRNEYASAQLLGPVGALHATLAGLHLERPSSALGSPTAGLSPNTSVGTGGTRGTAPAARGTAAVFRRQTVGNRFLPPIDTLPPRGWQHKRTSSCSSSDTVRHTGQLATTDRLHEHCVVAGQGLPGSLPIQHSVLGPSDAPRGRRMLDAGGGDGGGRLVLGAFVGYSAEDLRVWS